MYKIDTSSSFAGNHDSFTAYTTEFLSGGPGVCLGDAGFDLALYYNIVHHLELTNISWRWGSIYREDIAKISATYGYI